jgi:hypothetical protein
MLSDAGELHLVLFPPGLMHLITLYKGTHYILEYRMMDEIQK